MRRVPSGGHLRAGGQATARKGPQSKMASYPVKVARLTPYFRPSLNIWLVRLPDIQGMNGLISVFIVTKVYQPCQ